MIDTLCVLKSCFICSSCNWFCFMLVNAHIITDSVICLNSRSFCFPLLTNGCFVKVSLQSFSVIKNFTWLFKYNFCVYPT